jgi:hypothetical protein
MEPGEEETDLQNAHFYKGVIPIPDPTIRTTEQLLREIALSREIIETRFVALEKDISWLRAKVDRVPSLETVEYSVNANSNFQLEKFRGIEMKFSERDIRFSQASADSKMAIDKSEHGFTKQIDQMVSLISTMSKTLDDKIAEGNKMFDSKIGDVKDRVQEIEGHKKGTADIMVYVIAFIGFIISICSVIAVFHHGP